MRFLIYVFSLLLVVSFSSCNEPGPTDITEEVSGNDIESGSENSSMAESDRITLEIRNNPKNAELYMDRAAAYAAEGMGALALEDVNRALLLQPENARFHAVKGELLYTQKQVEDAVASFEKALEYDPQNTDALLKMAEIKLLLRQYQECFDLANAALRVNDQLYMGYFIKGYAHYELGDSTLFVSSVQTALELNPDFFDGFVLLASYYSTLNSVLALDYYDSALAIRPEDDQALYGKALFLQNAGRVDEAMELYEYMVSLDPQNALAWYNQGFIWLEVHGEPQSAIPFFKKAAEVYPEYDDAHYNLGLCYERSGSIEKAKSQYEKALEANPQHELSANGLDRLSRAN